jgi:hypothetical protein
LLVHDPDLGGYRFALLAKLTADVNGGTAVADFLHTLRIVDVTSADGSPVAGPITFDSGFTLNNMNAVPEPASLALWASGLFALVLRRRKRAWAIVISAADSLLLRCRRFPFARRSSE